VLWIFAGLLTLACCLWLFLASRASARLTAGEVDATTAFYRAQLAGIEQDMASGRLPEPEGMAAKAELAREYIRLESEQKAKGATRSSGRLALMAALPVVAIASIATYVVIGRADLPQQPLAERQLVAQNAEQSLLAAVEQVEARLVETPNDIRGWQAIAPFYMQAGRYSEAVNAFRRILDLEPPTAERETDLAEAMIMAGDGTADAESMALLRSAAERDPRDVRSRFYLAGELTRSGEFDEAISIWNRLLEIATGEEAWVATARAGLAAAQAGQTSAANMQPQEDGTAEVMIRGMVEGLAARLYDQGGSSEEWAQLVRSRLMLDGQERAQEDLDRGLADLDGIERTALAQFGTEAGLNVTE
jgi:cytochrome c-type biogenesis protein CcmH